MKPSKYCRIDGVHPAEYAQRWGCTTHDGVLFYNCSDCHCGEAIANTKWGPDEWERFAVVANEQAEGVRDRLADTTKDNAGWTRQDILDLRRLSEWAIYQQFTAKSTSPWVGTG